MHRLLRHARNYWKQHLFVAAVLASVLFALLGYGAKHYVTYKVRGPHGKVTLTVPATVAKQTAAALDDHRNARDQTPAGATASVLQAAQAQTARLAAQDRFPKHFPDAAPEQRGCTTRLVVNYSSRNGVAPHAFILHYTVSPNVTGWADVNAVVGLFNTASYQASSNYVYDNEGNCAYIVREVDKAWTQAAANPEAISVEIIDTGFEKTLLPPAARRKLAGIISDVLARWHIPVQLGAFDGGRFTRWGILDHQMLGTAGGGHSDISPRIVANGGEHFDNTAGLSRVRQVIADVKAYRASLVVKLPRWYIAAKKLEPMWAWISWRDHRHPVKLRPTQIPRHVPAAWWTRYAVHAGRP